MRVAVITLLGLLCLPAAGLAQQTATAAPDTELLTQPVADTEPRTAVELPPAATETLPAAEPDAAPDKIKPAALQPAADRSATGIGLGKMALSLAIVVAIVIALGWAFKKLTLRLPGSRHIKIISALPLGPKERLLVIEMQGKQRVLGVTAHSINLLFELENSLPEEKLASDFHTQLQSLLKK